MWTPRNGRSIHTIEEILRGTDYAFYNAGMGKGTGTGGSPVIAKNRKGNGLLPLPL